MLLGLLSFPDNSPLSDRRMQLDEALQGFDRLRRIFRLGLRVYFKGTESVQVDLTRNSSRSLGAYLFHLDFGLGSGQFIVNHDVSSFSDGLESLHSLIALLN